ncbi:2OG-Fe dioxygenase family protein [Amantichitinum ursilacus]|uniref:2OG-Fe dioxygenase family protein n=1 Tax=Amantichitinum ursilacus TaxID=857265 RepID=A0A0N0XK80_9NEIS|nr:2OG-Fe dioxygenase family protein [Amantichitinum ursilacus]KPC54477.1 hypothetical protein WG78_02840 [Amantichitinum ursilacus]
MEQLVVEHAQDLYTRTPDSQSTDVERLCNLVARKDFCFLNAQKTQQLLGLDIEHDSQAWTEFADSWNRLEQDQFMRDGGTYRYRRHATFSALPSGRQAYLEKHQPHYQSVDYNSLNGGIARDFAPFEDATVHGEVMQSILGLCCETFGALSPYFAWHIEAHQFRIYAQGAQAGNPTPEGVHRDGVNYVFMMMVHRQNVVNGTTRIYDRNKHFLTDFTLMQPFDTAIVNDERVMHGVTPIVQLDETREAYRDVLVVTFSKK